MKRGLIVFLIVGLFAVSFVSAGWFDWFKITGHSIEDAGICDNVEISGSDVVCDITTDKTIKSSQITTFKNSLGGYGNVQINILSSVLTLDSTNFVINDIAPIVSFNLNNAKIKRDDAYHFGFKINGDLIMENSELIKLDDLFVGGDARMVSSSADLLTRSCIIDGNLEMTNSLISGKPNNYINKFQIGGYLLMTGNSKVAYISGGNSELLKVGCSMRLEDNSEIVLKTSNYNFYVDGHVSIYSPAEMKIYSGSTGFDFYQAGYAKIDAVNLRAENKNSGEDFIREVTSLPAGCDEIETRGTGSGGGGSGGGENEVVVIDSDGLSEEEKDCDAIMSGHGFNVGSIVQKNKLSRIDCLNLVLNNRTEINISLCLNNDFPVENITFKWGEEILEQSVLDCGDVAQGSAPYNCSLLNCQYGCNSMGGCLPEPEITCNDSDGGKNYYEKGYTKTGITNESQTGDTGVAEDMCEEGGFLSEYFCKENKILKEKYSCPNGCKEGACINTTEVNLDSFETCGGFLGFMNSPSNFTVENSRWILTYNYTDNKDYSYTSFNLDKSNNYKWISVRRQNIDSSYLSNIKENMQDFIGNKLCSQRKINGQDVYICLNPWDIYYNQKNLLGNNNPYSKSILWVKDNNLFEVNSYSGGSWNCYSQESCEQRSNEIHRQQQENLIDAFNKLRDNLPDYVGGFYVDWEVEQVVSKILGLCKSDLDFKGKVCDSSWRCKIEPVICPPHGTQTQTCTQFCNGKENKVESEIQCSPGICAGCYIPRWFGDESGRNNKCIPYGFRFEQEGEWKIEEVVVEDKDTDTLTVEEAEGYGDDVGLEVYEDNTALLILETKQNTYVNISLEEGKEYNWGKLVGYVGGDVEFLMFVDEIYYDQNDYKNSYIKATFTAKGIREGKVMEMIGMYCDIDGRAKEQKTVDYRGDWAKCQNNYECESNFCSSGECVEIQSMLESASVFKRIGIRVWCRFAHPINRDEFYSCMQELSG